MLISGGYLVCISGGYLVCISGGYLVCIFGGYLVYIKDVSARPGFFTSFTYTHLLIVHMNKFYLAYTHGSAAGCWLPSYYFGIDVRLTSTKNSCFEMTPVDPSRLLH